MRKILFPLMLSLFWLLNSPSVFANKIVELSEPTPQIPGQIPIGESHTFTYQIINNAPGHRFKIEIRGLKHFMSRTTVPNDCGNVLPVGPSTCNIGITVAPTESEAGKSLHEEIEIHHQGRAPLRAAVEFLAPGLPVYAAVGINGDNLTPLIAVSNDQTGKGQTWSVKSPKNYRGILNASNCIGSYPNTICVAVGSRNIDSALILRSITDSNNPTGTPWVEPNFDPVRMPLTDVICRGNSTSAFCIAISTSPAVRRQANAFISHDGGRRWKLTTSFQSNVSLTGLSCSGNEGNSICAVVAETGQVFVSTNNAMTWTTLNLNDQLSSVSCLGGSKTGICVITSTNGAYVIKAQSLGTIPSKIALSPRLALTTSACTGTPADPLCVLGGYTINPSNNLNVPVVYVSNTRGLTTWTNPAIQGYLGAGVSSVAVSNLSCTGSGSTATCLAVGNETLLAISQNGGQTWTQKASTPHQYLFASSCNFVPGTSGPPTVTCLAAGSSTNLLANPNPDYTGTPDLYVSPDNGSTWYHSPVDNEPTTGGYIGIGVTPP